MNEKEIIRQHLNDDVYALSLKTHWFEGYDKKWLIRQIQSRQKAKSKLPSWYGNFDLIFPVPLSVEQSSSELTAEYKASLVSGNILLDLTGGMGVDTSCFARHFQTVFFVEKQSELADTAEHNFKMLHLDNIRVIHADSMQYLENLPHADCIFIDPSRRKADQKVFLIEDCEPDILQYMPALMQKASAIILKLSPMLDLKAVMEKLPLISEIHIVAVNHELKELVVMLRAMKSDRVSIFCVNIDKNGTRQVLAFSDAQRNEPVEMAVMPLTYLYEPHATLLKGGLMNAEANRYGLLKLHPHSQLYTSEMPQFQFSGRIFRIQSYFGLSKQELKAELAGITKANITVRNFPIDEKTLRKKLKISDGGHITLFATTLIDGKHVLLKTERVSALSLSCPLKP